MAVSRWKSYKASVALGGRVSRDLQRRGGAILDAPLSEEVFDVLLDGSCRDAENRPDLPIGLGLGDPSRHLPLFRGQPIVGRFSGIHDRQSVVVVVSGFVRSVPSIG